MQQSVHMLDRGPLVLFTYKNKFRIIIGTIPKKEKICYNHHIKKYNNAVTTEKMKNKIVTEVFFYEVAYEY